MAGRPECTHPAAMQLREEAKSYAAKIQRKRPLWSFKISVWEDCLILENLWPSLSKDSQYFPNVPYEPFGRYLHVGILRAFEVAEEHGLRLMVGQKYRQSFMNSAVDALHSNVTTPFKLKVSFVANSNRLHPRYGEPILNRYFEAVPKKRRDNGQEES